MRSNWPVGRCPRRRCHCWACFGTSPKGNGTGATGSATVIRCRSCTASVTRTSTEPSPSRPRSTLLYAALGREQAATDAALVEHPDLSERLGKNGIAVRELMVHRIEEYARHCGHADLLRECIDGRVGQ